MYFVVFWDQVGHILEHILAEHFILAELILVERLPAGHNPELILAEHILEHMLVVHILAQRLQHPFSHR